MIKKLGILLKGIQAGLMHGVDLIQQSVKPIYSPLNWISYIGADLKQKADELSM